MSFYALISNATDGDISVMHFDAASARLRLAQRCTVGERVMPMALMADQRTLYAGLRGAPPAFARFSLDARAGQLTRHESTPVRASMAYVAVDPRGRYLLGASYGDDLVGIYSLERLRAGDGEPLQVVGGIRHAHAVIVSRDGRFAYATSLGDGQVICMALGEGNAQPLAEFDRMPTGAGFGPRHLRFSPDEQWLYVVGEFRGSVQVFQRHAETGRLTPWGETPRAAPLAHLGQGIARPLPTNPVQPSAELLAGLVWAADMHVRPDGRYVYVSERTTSRLLVYRTGTLGGTLEYAGSVETETQPRGFRIDASGAFLVACGEKSPHVSVYGIDPDSGQLTPLARCEGGQGANWVEIITAG